MYLSPARSLLNWSVMIHMKVGPMRAPSTKSSLTPPIHRSTLPAAHMGILQHSQSSKYSTHGNTSTLHSHPNTAHMRILQHSQSSKYSTHGNTSTLTVIQIQHTWEYFNTHIHPNTAHMGILQHSHSSK